MTTKIMTKKSKPGDLFNRFQAKKKKMQSEADAGSMKGYDPNLGLGKSGYARARAVPKATPFKLTTKNMLGGGAANQIPGALTPRVSTQATSKTPNIQYKKKKTMSSKHCKSCTC